MTTKLRVLVMGGSGMLGHRLCRHLSDKPEFDVVTTVRTAESSHMLPDDKTVLLPHADNELLVREIVGRIAPRFVVNCIGIVKQSKLAGDSTACIRINSLLPHVLRDACLLVGAKLIHVSTDCVFSGRLGNYTEQNPPDADDLYGRTKLLGEVAGADCLTIRTSIIGRELGTQRGLLEWFLANAGGTVRGFTDHQFSGLTTQALSETLAEIMLHHSDLQGVYHVASDPISKYSILRLLDRVYHTDTAVTTHLAGLCDRTLNDRRFRVETKIPKQSWSTMIWGMYADSQFYKEWSERHAIAR